MSLDLNEIALVAQAVLDRLSHGGVRWATTKVLSMPSKDLEASRTVLITASSTSDPSVTIGSYFVVGIPTQLAIMQLASSLQDEVIERTRAAVPTCPGHPHPMAPRLEQGRAVWACPFDGGPVDDICG
jgi:hypothetical protein